MATACRSLHEGLALNIVEGLSADCSDYCRNLTSGKGDCLRGGVMGVCNDKLLRTISSFKLLVLSQSAAKP